MVKTKTSNHEITLAWLSGDSILWYAVPFVGIRSKAYGRFAEDAGTRQLTICDCQGQVSRQERVHISKGLLSIEVPAAGVVTLSQ